MLWDTPRRTLTVPVKLAPSRVSLHLTEPLQPELDYMLEHKLIETCQSACYSPVDFRNVNAITKADTYPLPRVDECIDRGGNSKYSIRFDLLKGYWQVPLTFHVLLL